MENNIEDTDMDDLQIMSSGPTPITPELLIVKLGETLLALMLGEIFHRIILICEELPHVKERLDVIFKQILSYFIYPLNSSF